jgi:3'(2'), 5'-bisphosphate nucleotidase
MKKELEKAKIAARKAGEEILRFYNEGAIGIETKNNKTPVTEADLASEKIILNELSDFKYGIVSEEMLGSDDRKEKKRTWIIDPLDGTSDFISRTGEFSVMIGLVERGEPILGVVYQPVIDKMYYAVKGEGAFVEEKGETKKLIVSEKNNFKDFIMVASRHHLQPLDIAVFENLGMKEKITFGSAGLKIGLMTENKGDFYICPSHKTGEWDICAGDIILSEAGGKTSDLNGDKIKYNKDTHYNENGFVCSNGVLHEEIIIEIKK